MTIQDALKPGATEQSALYNATPIHQQVNLANHGDFFGSGRCRQDSPPRSQASAVNPTTAKLSGEQHDLQA
ncbi:MAG: hypothetical protein D8M59_09825 [Planctomycetes bacterium]|nr:hypothetical protein [Planctomycetota bacterium]